MNQEMVEVRTIAEGFLNYTKATAISLNGIRLLCYLGILCRVALTDHSTRKIPGRYHIYILLIAAADMVLTGNCDLYNRIPGAAAVAGPMLVLSILIPGAFGGGDIKFMAVSGFLLGKEKIICSMACAVMLAGGYCLIMLKCGKLTRKDEFAFGPFLVLGIMMTLFAGDQLILWFWQGI